MRPAPSVSRPTSTSMASPAAPPPPAAAALPASPWHSPVPYLFGGLAAMLGLITLALLILACSYWKLNNYLGTGRDATSSSSGPGATDGDDGSKSPAAASPATFADLVAVVMAGEKMPTFLAAPIVRREHGNSAAATGTGEGSPAATKPAGGQPGLQPPPTAMISMEPGLSPPYHHEEEEEGKEGLEEEEEEANPP